MITDDTQMTLFTAEGLIRGSNQFVDRGEVKLGTPSDPINVSKGCGGVMRVAPVGLVAPDAFDPGCRAAAITHGDPSGWVAAGALAELIAQIVQGQSIRTGVDAALDRCMRQRPDWARYPPW
jgi:ADP-ribosylglycohydrolase